MNLQKIFLISLIFIAFLQICFGQNETEFVEGETWVQQYGIYRPTQYMAFRYDRYSKEDTVKFREKLDLLKTAKFRSEWEGEYYRGVGDDVGISSFRLDSNAGFVDFYIYTCFSELRSINYGKVLNMPDFILITPEFAMDSPRKSLPVKYVKIKWNDRDYLVEETSLSAFAEKIVGIYIEPAHASDEDHQKWSNYWVKGNTEKELTGLPEFPPNYKSFQRSPIETKIISVGKRSIEDGVETARWTSADETAVYQITIGDGVKKGVKKGMVFGIPETDDAILITQVYQNYATGIVGRSIDENKNDYCLDNNSNQIDCPKIKPNFKAKTVIGEF